MSFPEAGWLEVRQGTAPFILSLPHTGTLIPGNIEARFVSPWLACRDSDWWVEQLYDFAQSLGGTIVRTQVSRSVIDVNRDPSGASLYPGQATTELCPSTTFDGEPLYKGSEPDDAEVSRRRRCYFEPYHAALTGQIARLRCQHRRIVVFDAHAIRSRIPRLFKGELPHLNLGTNNGTTCDPALASAALVVCRDSQFSHVLDGRFRGGWTTRHYGRPVEGVHAIQMELACRGYMDEPDDVAPGTWPPPYSEERAAPLRQTLKLILEACLAFARG